MKDIVVSESETKNDDNVIILLEPVTTDLEQLRSRNFKFNYKEQVLFLLFQGLRAIQYIHSQGISHCEILPQHILLSSKLELKLCDFQHAKPSDNERNRMDILSFLDSVQNVALESVWDSTGGKLMRNLEFASITELLQNDLFSCFKKDDILQSSDKFDWKRDCKNSQEMAVDTIIHLISLESSKCKESTGLVKTSEQLALECELTHGVQCGEQFNLTRMRFENDQMQSKDHSGHISDNIFNSIFQEEPNFTKTNDSGFFNALETDVLKTYEDVRDFSFLSQGSHFDIGTELSFAWME